MDMGESDFGSRANFGRGNDQAALSAGCDTSYASFLRRLSNVAVNRLNRNFSESTCVLGSIDCDDLSVDCMDLSATEPSQRARLIRAVGEVEQRGTALVGTVLGSASNARVYLVNGDHDHMTSAVGGVIARGKYGAVDEVDGSQQPVRPAVVYLDLHADSRPLADGPHSGTWCSQILDEVRHVSLSLTLALILINKFCFQSDSFFIDALYCSV